MLYNLFALGTAVLAISQSAYAAVLTPPPASTAPDLSAALKAPGGFDCAQWCSTEGIVGLFYPQQCTPCSKWRGPSAPEVQATAIAPVWEPTPIQRMIRYLIQYFLQELERAARTIRPRQLVVPALNETLDDSWKYFVPGEAGEGDDDDDYHNPLDDEEAHIWDMLGGWSTDLSEPEQEGLAVAGAADSSTTRLVRSANNIAVYLLERTFGRPLTPLMRRALRIVAAKVLLRPLTHREAVLLDQWMDWYDVNPSVPPESLLPSGTGSGSVDYTADLSDFLRKLRGLQRVATSGLWLALADPGVSEDRRAVVETELMLRYLRRVVRDEF